MIRIFPAVLLTFAIAGSCFAQGPFGQGPATTPASRLDMARLQTVSGAVTAVAIGYGWQYPSITVAKVQIKVAPAWYLLENDFEVKVGDVLDVQAAPAASAADPYLYAVAIVAAATGRRLRLRDVSGVPLWANPQAIPRDGLEGQGTQGSPPAVATGTVERMDSGFGIQMPTLTLRTADGSLLTFKLGPERVLLQSDLELKAGDPVTVLYVSPGCRDELVALSITSAAGKTVVLRDGSGRPGWR